VTDPITPVDIVHQTFSRRLMGCDHRQVQEFLEKAAASFGAALQEVESLRQELTAARQLLQEKEKDHEELRAALALAEKAAEQIRSNAVKEAELTVREGQENARRIVEDAQLQAAEIQRQAEAVNQQKLRLQAEMRALLESYLSTLPRDERSPASGQAGKT
jgi:cell division initiation protein